MNGDPAVGKFLQFRVQAYGGFDNSLDPADYVPVLADGQPGKKMIPLPGFTQEELATARHRTFEFGRSNGTDSAPWTIKTDGGKAFGMDPRRLSAAPAEGAVEIWHIKNGGGGWSHPIHVHFEEGQILKRGGKAPPPNGRSGPARICIGSDACLTVPRASILPSGSGSSSGPSWSTATTPSTRTTPCS